MTSTKLCSRCEVFIPLDQFGSSKGRINARCKRCCVEASTEWAKANPEKRTQTMLRHTLKTYGLTIDSYNDLLESQGGGCAICGAKESTRGNGKTSRLVVDHNHDTGEVRGLLCHLCNTGIGCLQDDEELVQKALNYLRRNNG